MFGAEEVALKYFEGSVGEGAEGALFIEETREELIDKRVKGIAGSGLQLAEAMPSAGEFAQRLSVGEKFFVRPE